MKYGVVLASFNGSDFILEQLQSIVCQTKKVDQIIISDDGSSDGTIKIINDFIKNNPKDNIKLVHHKSSHFVADNFLYGIKQLQDDIDYVFFADQDDIWLDNKVENFSKEIELYSSNVVFSDCYVVDQNISIIDKSLVKNFEYAFPNLKTTETEMLSFDELSLEKCIDINFITGMNMCVKKSFIDSVIPVPKGCLHDKWFMLMAITDDSVLFIPKRLAYYRQHSNNQVGINKKNSLKQKLKKISKYSEKLYEKIEYLNCLNYKLSIKENISENFKKYIFNKREFTYNRFQLIESKNSKIGRCYGLLKKLKEYQEFEKLNYKKVFLKDLFVIVFK